MVGKAYTHMNYPKLTRPNTSPFTRPYDRVGGFALLHSAPFVRTILPYYDVNDLKSGEPRRKAMKSPQDNGSFVKPIKQSFVRNPRIMPMTRLMLILLAGWNGKGGNIETTTGTIARNLSRSRRMVFNYLKDAMAQGYLTYTRRKDRMGYYVGICIKLNTQAIRKHFKAKKMKSKREKSAETRDRKLNADTNLNYRLDKESDDKLMASLARIAVNIGYISPNAHPIE